MKSKWFKKLGAAAFMFFLVKGLIWIAVFAGLGKWVMGMIGR